MGKFLVESFFHLMDLTTYYLKRPMKVSREELKIKIIRKIIKPKQVLQSHDIVYYRHWP